MPLPVPQKDEERSDFITRCMIDRVAREEFPDAVQRIAVCVNQWEAYENATT